MRGCSVCRAALWDLLRYVDRGPRGSCIRLGPSRRCALRTRETTGSQDTAAFTSSAIFLSTVRLHFRMAYEHGPYVACVEVRRIQELQARVAGVELARVLEGDDNLAVGVRISGHTAPGLGRQLGCARGDRGVNPLSEGAIRRSHPLDGVKSLIAGRVELLAGVLGSELSGHLSGGDGVHVQAHGAAIDLASPRSPDLEVIARGARS